MVTPSVDALAKQILARLLQQASAASGVDDTNSSCSNSDGSSHSNSKSTKKKRNARLQPADWKRDPTSQPLPVHLECARHGWCSAGTIHRNRTPTQFDLWHALGRGSARGRHHLELPPLPAGRKRLYCDYKDLPCKSPDGSSSTR